MKFQTVSISFSSCRLNLGYTNLKNTNVLWNTNCKQGVGLPSILGRSHWSLIPIWDTWLARCWWGCPQSRGRHSLHCLRQEQSHLHPPPRTRRDGRSSSHSKDILQPTLSLIQTLLWDKIQTCHSMTSIWMTRLGSDAWKDQWQLLLSM